MDENNIGLDVIQQTSDGVTYFGWGNPGRIMIRKNDPGINVLMLANFIPGVCLAFSEQFNRNNFVDSLFVPTRIDCSA